MKANAEKYYREWLEKFIAFSVRFFQIVHHNLKLKVIVTGAILERCEIP